MPYDVFILTKDFPKELIDSDITPNIFIKNNHILSKISVLVSKKFLKADAKINSDNFVLKH